MYSQDSWDKALKIADVGWSGDAVACDPEKVAELIEQIRTEERARWADVMLAAERGLRRMKELMQIAREQDDRAQVHSLQTEILADDIDHADSALDAIKKGNAA